MKQVMKSLKHNGIYVPQYEHKGFKVKIRGETVKLTTKSEQMAIAWIRKRQSAASPPDKVFMKNFMREFLEQLRRENQSLQLLEAFAPEYSQKIENYSGNDIGNSDSVIHKDIDFTEISDFVKQEKQNKENMPSAEKKQKATERKAAREEMKAKYGFAEVDGQKLEIANWTAEPSCLFAGRGEHPQRGRWKEGPREEDIILNWPLDEQGKPVLPVPSGNWKGVVWE